MITRCARSWILIVLVSCVGVFWAVGQATAVLIDFDDVVVPDTGPNSSAQFSNDQYQSVGIVFDDDIALVNVNTSSDTTFVANVFTSRGSFPNALRLPGDTSGFDIIGTFVIPGTSTPAVTDLVEVLVFDSQANAGTSQGTLSAFDINGTRLQSISMTTPVGEGDNLYSINTPGIASILLEQDSDGGLFDDLTFNNPTPVPVPSTLLLLSSGLAWFGGVGRITLFRNA